MAAAHKVLQNLSPLFQKNGTVRMASQPQRLEKQQLEKESFSGSDAPSFEDWKERLLRGELSQGAVVELASEGGVALGTSIALRACQRIQQEARAAHQSVPWCAFIDPTESLYAPGVHAAGVDLSKLLIVRPTEENISRVTLRLTESRIFPLVVVDLMGLPGRPLDLSLGPWVKVVRRLILALERRPAAVVLLTNKNARRPLPLPVTERFILSRTSLPELTVTVSKCSWASPGQGRLRWTRAQPAQALIGGVSARAS